MMQSELNSISLTTVAAALADALGVEPPREANEPAAPLAALAVRAFHGRKATRALLYLPDAVGMWLYQKYTADFVPVLERTQLALPLKTASPSVTPVCFATMFTGAYPAVHGLTRPKEKPVVPVDTLFDSLARAGKRAAIVAVEGSSMSKIYKERAIDYHILPYDDEVTERALELIDRNEHDVIAVYNQEYDDRMHATQPESPEAYQALKNHIASFAQLHDAAAQAWAGHDWLTGFMTDHGIHTGADGRGTHGEDIPEDLNIMHFYGVTAKKV